MTERQPISTSQIVFLRDLMQSIRLPRWSDQSVHHDRMFVQARGDSAKQISAMLMAIAMKRAVGSAGSQSRAAKMPAMPTHPMAGRFHVLTQLRITHSLLSLDCRQGYPAFRRAAERACGDPEIQEASLLPPGTCISGVQVGILSRCTSTP